MVTSQVGKASAEVSGGEHVVWLTHTGQNIKSDLYVFKVTRHEMDKADNSNGI